jgi:hypothetical protein
MWSPIATNSHVFSFIWTIHQTINGSTSRFHLKASTPSYPFQTKYLRPIMPKFYHVLVKGECLAYNSTNFPMFSISFPSLFHKVSYTTWIAPSFNYRYPFMHVHTFQWPYGYPPFTLCSWQRVHNNPWCNFWHLYCHCMKCWFPCGVKQLHGLPSNTFNSFCQQVNIVFTKNNIHTIVDIIITHPTWMNLLLRFCAT